MPPWRPDAGDASAAMLYKIATELVLRDV